MKYSIRVWSQVQHSALLNTIPRVLQTPLQPYFLLNVLLGTLEDLDKKNIHLNLNAIRFIKFTIILI